MDREVLKQKVLIASFASLLCIGSVAAQVRKSNPSATPEEPPLRPLTDGERALNLKSIVANQPDFVADEVFFIAKASVASAPRDAWRGRETVTSSTPAR